MAGDKEQETAKKGRKKPPARQSRKKPQTRRETGRETRREAGLIVRSVGFVWRAFWKTLWALFWRAAIVGLFILAGATGYYYAQLPPVQQLFDGRGGGSVTMLDRNGNVFAWRGEQYGGDLTIHQVSPYLIHAVVATEDRRFYDHFGIDPIGIARAMVANIRAGHLVQGGSTITQQVAKNVFLTAKRTYERKLKEVPMAFALELKYTKDQILSIYMNRVYLGSGTYGFEAASQRYFGKSAKMLDPAEAAMLAGMLRAPSRYAPTNDLSRSQGRAAVIIRLMEDQGYLTRTQANYALAHPAGLSQAAAAHSGGYFADWVMEQAPDYLAKDTTEDVTIATTFDPAAQKAAEDGVAKVFDQKVKDSSVAQAAVVVMTPDGAVRAMVGGHQKGVGQFNRATHAKRQTGSAFKPIVYAAALQAGMHPMDTVMDAPLRIGDWTPENYDHKYRGRITLADALAHSVNTATVRVEEAAGEKRVREMAKRLGITTPLAPGPAIALGTSEATLVDMTGVYATIADKGRKADVRGIRSITLRGEKTPLMTENAGPGEQVLSERNAELLTWMMKGVIDRGTGHRAQLPDREAAGKTGTTQAARDAWFIGFTADYVVGVWMGNDDNSPLTGVAGGGLPAEIWRQVMVELDKGVPPSPLPMVAPDSTSTVLAGGDGGGGSSGGGVVRQVFMSVINSLTGGGGGGGKTDFKPKSGADR